MATISGVVEAVSPRSGESCIHGSPQSMLLEVPKGVRYAACVSNVIFKLSLFVRALKLMTFVTDQSLKTGG